MPTTESLQAIFRQEYSEFYKTEHSDSPKSSREELKDLFIQECLLRLQAQDLIRVIDLGAGIQVLESELVTDSRFDSIKEHVKLLTVDIADVESKQLLAPLFLHVQADATQLPFPDSSVDVVISSSALDFVGESVLAEIQRVLDTNGTLIATFHHPKLIEIAKERLNEIENKLHSTYTKLQFSERAGSNKVSQLKQKILDLQRQKQDALFCIHKLPNLVFRSADDLANTLNQHFPTGLVTVEERNGAMGENGWYIATVKLEYSQTQ